MHAALSCYGVHSDALLNLLNTLYDSLHRHFQLRASVQPAIDDSDEKNQVEVTYAWTDISSGDGSSMNANGDCDASTPALHAVNASLRIFAAWVEDCGNGDTHIRVAEFNEDVDDPVIHSRSSRIFCASSMLLQSFPADNMLKNVN